MIKKGSFEKLVKVMSTLRAPGGCPWDREQTHESLLKYLKEESAEMVQAVKKKDYENLEEELGDILLQVLFHADIAEERGDFDINDVIETLRHKLINRHPHVFTKNKKFKTANDVRKNWSELKTIDKKKRAALRKKRKKS